MSQKSVYTVTAIEIKSPQGSTLLTKSETAKTILLSNFGTSFVAMADGTEDTRIVTSDGWSLVIQEELSDFATALSATSITGS